MEYYRPTTCDEDVIHHYMDWDIKHNFLLRADSMHGSSWIDTNFVFMAWKPRENHSGSLSIPQKYITFVKNTLLTLRMNQANETLVSVKLFGCEQPPIISNNFVHDLLL